MAQESLAAGAVAAGDADRGVDAEATGRPGSSPGQALPGEHIGDGGLVEEFTPPEEAEHAAAHHLLKPLDVPGAGITRLVEMVQAIGIFREEAVEKDQVEVEVGIQRRAEAVEKEAAFVSSPTSFISSA